MNCELSKDKALLSRSRIDSENLFDRFNYRMEISIYFNGNLCTYVRFPALTSKSQTAEVGGQSGYISVRRYWFRSTPTRAFPSVK